MRIRWSLVLLVVVGLFQLSCAAGTITPMQESMPAARAGLLPEYRLFYDALQDYGDWILVEPYGYVFRPTGEMANWRPYSDGYWAPSDTYGWVWISAESFGWATYHYGNWLYDKFQGWVWVPGLDWAPAWVSWEQTPDYIGWSPQFPAGYQASVPGGPYIYVPTSQLAATDLRTKELDQSAVMQGAPQVEVVRNMDERDGVHFNRGPDIAEIERVAGPLERVKVEEFGGLASNAGTKGVSAARAPGNRKVEPAPAPAADARPLAERVREAAEKQAQEVRSTSESASAPVPKIQIFRLQKPGEKPAAGSGLRGARKPKPAVADSTR